MRGGGAGGACGKSELALLWKVRIGVTVESQDWCYCYCGKSGFLGAAEVWKIRTGVTVLGLVLL